MFYDMYLKKQNLSPTSVNNKSIRTKWSREKMVVRFFLQPPKIVLTKNVTI